MTPLTPRLLPLDPAVPGGWWLCGERALIHRDERTAVIADVHLGYEWARGTGGDVIPAHSMVETKESLQRMLALAPIDRLVVAGDLLESGHCGRSRADVEKLRGWLRARGVSLEILLGNHDGDDRGLHWVRIGEWSIGHGHTPFPGARKIIGHVHPIIEIGGVAAPCFVVGRASIVLPAHSSNAAGIDVRALTLPAWLRLDTPRHIAALEGELFDLGEYGAASGRGARGVSRKPRSRRSRGL